MVVTLRQGTRTFVLRTGRTTATALAPIAARELLRRAAREDPEPLRHALAAASGEPAVHALDHDTLLRKLEPWIALGALTVHEVVPPPVEITPRAPVDEAPIAAAAPLSARDPEPAPAPQKTWITIALVREDDAPIANQRYRIELPDGSVREGSLDGQGQVYLRDIDPGQCRVTFPDL